MDKTRLLNALNAVVAEATLVVNALRDRGVKRYGRALGIAAGMIFLSHRLVYLAGKAELSRVESGLAAVKGAARYFDTYRELDAQLRGFAQTLPPRENPDNWLLSAVRDSMKEEGILASSLSPIVKLEWSHFRFMTLTVNFRGSYAQVAAWINRMERSSKLLHVSKLAVHKDSREPGLNDVTISVASAVPKEEPLP